jgi:hypothetical protein
VVWFEQVIERAGALDVLDRIGREFCGRTWSLLYEGSEHPSFLWHLFLLFLCALRSKIILSCQSQEQ